MKTSNAFSRLLFLSLLAAGSTTLPTPTAAQGSPPEQQETFGQALTSVQQQLADSLDELTRLRERIAAEQIPLGRQLGELEGELSDLRQKYQQTTRLLDGRTLDLTNLQGEIKARKEEASYLSNLLSEYIRNFESRLHITELQRYAEVVEAARLAPENSNLSQQEVYQAQAALLAASLDRLNEAVGGVRFEGSAVDASGLVKPGTFVLVGPAAVFQAADGSAVGTAEQRLGSLEPTIFPFDQPIDAEAARALVSNGRGSFPLDPTLGNAHKIEATHETLLEHIKKGGTVMIPIFALAGAALLVVLFKWLSMAFVRKPSERRVRALLEAMASGDREVARDAAKGIRGPAGKMLQAGVEHLGEPRDLIEEVMYETLLATRLRLQRFLPFVAISASSAPLLGLLGTVTGIMETFKLITVFGTGDVKTLSSGISEALITTEYGLIVAIPSLLLHAFLSRKARGVVDQMEKSAVAFLNQVARTPFARERATRAAAEEGERDLVPAAPRVTEGSKDGSGKTAVPAARR